MFSPAGPGRAGARGPGCCESHRAGSGSAGVLRGGRGGDGPKQRRMRQEDRASTGASEQAANANQAIHSGALAGTGTGALTAAFWQAPTAPSPPPHHCRPPRHRRRRTTAAHVIRVPGPLRCCGTSAGLRAAGVGGALLPPPRRGRRRQDPVHGLTCSVTSSPETFRQN